MTRRRSATSFCFSAFTLFSVFVVVVLLPACYVDIVVIFVSVVQVGFIHKSWDLVMNVMLGVRLAVGRIAKVVRAE